MLSEKEAVNVYIDGPNLLGAVSDMRKGRRVWVDPFQLAQLLIRRESQELKQVYYMETPYQGNLHNPDTFRKQQRLFGIIHKYISDGRVKHIKGVYRIDEVKVPHFILKGLSEEVRPLVESLRWHKPIEKGGDVGLAVQMVRDACLRESERVILVAADQDYAPAINIIQDDLNIDVSISYVQNTYRNATALKNRCRTPHFIQITRGMIDACEVKEKGEG